MSPPTPPASALPYLAEAAQGTGIPLAVVESQNYTESAYGTNDGPSSAGALGPWQFEPYTWAGLGLPAGQEYDWATSTKGYITYMNQLLKQEGGSVFKALEAYNAGPGDLPAGAGYASGIISMSGQSSGISSGGGSGSSGGGINEAGFPIPIPIPGLGGVGSSVTNDVINAILKSIGITSLKDMFQRLGLILLGAVLIIIGINILSKNVMGGATQWVNSAMNSGNSSGETEEPEQPAEQSTDTDSSSESTSQPAKAKPRNRPAGKTASKSAATGAGAKGTGSLASEAGEMAVVA